MFLDTRDPWPAPEPWRPAAPRRLTPRGERVLMRLIAVNLLLLFLAPIGGSSLIAAILWLLR